MVGTDGDVIELADGDGVEVVPVGGAVVRGVEAAVAADEHVAGVAGVDPKRVLIGVNTLAGVGAERFAAVGGFEEIDPADVDEFLVLGIDFDIAEVHGAGVEAVDALPGLAAVGGFVDAAVFVAVGALLILDVFDLSAKIAERGTSSGCRGAVGEGEGDVARLLAGFNFEVELVAGFVGANHFDQLFVFVESFSLGRDDIA